MSITVRTKQELASAQKAGATEIVVEGDLANDLHKSKRATKLGGLAAIAALGTGLAFAPFTRGRSGALGLAAAVTISGMEAAVIMATLAVGISLVIAVWNGYEEVEFSQDPLKLKLKRKSKG